MGYPSKAQRARLEGFPDRITVEDVRACFALSEGDRALVFGRYELHRQPPPAGRLRPLRETSDDRPATPTPPQGVSGDKH